MVKSNWQPETALTLPVDLTILEQEYRDRKFTMEERLQIGLWLAEGTMTPGEVVERYEVSRTYPCRIKDWAVRYIRALRYKSRMELWEEMERAAQEMQAAMETATTANYRAFEDPPGTDGSQESLTETVTAPMCSSPEMALTTTVGTMPISPLVANGPGFVLTDKPGGMQSSDAQPLIPDVVLLSDIDALGEALSPLWYVIPDLVSGLNALTGTSGNLAAATGMETPDTGALDQITGGFPGILTSVDDAVRGTVNILRSTGIVSNMPQPDSAIAPLMDAVSVLVSGLRALSGAVVSLVNAVPVLIQAQVASTAPAPMSGDTVNYGKLAPRRDTSLQLVTDQDCIRKTVISLAVVCRASERAIRRHIQDVCHVNISESDISRIIHFCNERAKNLNACYDQLTFPFIFAGAFDEICFGHEQSRPTLTGADPGTHYIFLIAPEDDRQNETWILHLWELQERGLTNLRIILADNCGSLALAVEKAFGRKPQSDVFHLEKDLGKEVEILIKKTCAILGDQWKTENSDRTVLKWIDVEENVLPHAMSVCDQIEILYSDVRELIDYSGYTPEEAARLPDDVLNEMLTVAAGGEYRKLRAAIHHFQENAPIALTFLRELYNTFETRANAEGVDPRLLKALCEVRRYRCDGVRYGQALASAFEMADHNTVVYNQAQTLLSDILANSFRASGVVENSNGRYRRYGDDMDRDPRNRSELIRFTLNAIPFDHSRLDRRRGSSAIEQILGEAPDYYGDLGIRDTVVLTGSSNSFT